MTNYENDILNIFEKSARVINESKASIKEINSAVNVIVKTIEKGKKLNIWLQNLWVDI
jgi:hypothetical protein